MFYIKVKKIQMLDKIFRLKNKNGDITTNHDWTL